MAGINDYLAYLRTEKRYSEHTLISYRKDLEQYHAFCQDHGKEGMDLFFKTIRSWVVFMMEQGYTPRTIHRKLSSLRSYCKYLIRKGVLDTDPVEKVLKPKMNRRLPQFVDEKGINELLDHYDFGDDYPGVRNRLLVNLLYQTGIRRSELAGLTLGSLDLRQGMVRVRGKRDKERMIPLGRELAGEIERYLELRSERFPGSGEVLFLTDRGAPVYVQMVYRVVNKYLRLITTLEKTSPHILRHSFATHMLNNGAELNAIKELLGHSSLSATQVYTHNTFEKLKSIYKQAHPRA
mgnify:CR=1 FL=1